MDQANRQEKINQLKEKVAFIKNIQLNGYDEISDPKWKSKYDELYNAIIEIDGKEDTLPDKQIVEKIQQLDQLSEKLINDVQTYFTAKNDAISNYKDIHVNIHQSLMEFQEPKYETLKTELESVLINQLNDEQLSKISDGDIIAQYNEIKVKFEEIKAQKEKIDAEEQAKHNAISEYNQIFTNIETNKEQFSDSLYQDLLEELKKILNSKLSNEELDKLNSQQISSLNNEAKEQFNQLAAQKIQRQNDRDKFKAISEYKKTLNSLNDLLAKINEQKNNGYNSQPLEELINQAKSFVFNDETINNLTALELQNQNTNFKANIEQLDNAYTQWLRDATINELKTKISNIRANELNGYDEIKNSDFKAIATELLNSFKDYEGKESELDNTTIKQALEQIKEAQKRYEAQMNEYKTQRITLWEEYFKVYNQSKNFSSEVKELYYHNYVRYWLAKSQENIADETTFDDYSNDEIRTMITKLTEGIKSANEEKVAVAVAVEKYNETYAKAVALMEQAKMENWRYPDWEYIKYSNDLTNNSFIKGIPDSSDTINDYFTAELQRHMEYVLKERELSLEMEALDANYNTMKTEILETKNSLIGGSNNGDYRNYWYMKIEPIVDRVEMHEEFKGLNGILTRESIDENRRIYESILAQFNEYKAAKTESDAKQAELLNKWNDYRNNEKVALNNKLSSDPRYTDLLNEFNKIWEEVDEKSRYKKDYAKWLLSDLENLINTTISKHDAIMAKIAEIDNA